MGNEPSRPSPPPPPAPNGGSGDPARPAGVLAGVDVDLVQRISNTSDFDSDKYVVTRRDVEFPLTLQARARPIVTAAALHDGVSGNAVELTFREDSTRSTRSTSEWRIHVPADAPVGVYELRVSGRLEGGGDFAVSLQRQVVVLFNAWSQNDAVFLESAEERQEYVLNENGRVYAGSVYGMPWSLALHKEETLGAVLLLLSKASQLSFQQRASPVLVSREMSAMVNSQDDRGVLVGNWSGNYEGGNSPSYWHGSGKILGQYFRSGGVPVRYGQCWVFSGVLLSVLRVLGIPSRSVTNFSSAHDTNRNRTIDEYYSEEGDKIGYLSSGSDSVW